MDERVISVEIEGREQEVSLAPENSEREVMITQEAVLIDEPTGEVEITANGNYDVKQYATAEVNVASAGGAILDETEMATIKWSSDTTATFNGYYEEAFSPTEEDLAEAAKVTVYVPRTGAITKTRVTTVLYDGATISEPLDIKYFPGDNIYWTNRLTGAKATRQIQPAGFLSKYFPNLVGFAWFENTSSVFSAITSYFSFEGLKKLEIVGTLYFGGGSKNLASLCKNCWRLLYVGTISVSSTNAFVLTSMFENCYSLRKVVFKEISSGTQNEKATSFTNMLANCYSLAYLDISAFNITALSSLFDDTVMTNVPTDCQIVVGTEDDKTTWLTLYPDYTNVSVRGAE